MKRTFCIFLALVILSAVAFWVLSADERYDEYNYCTLTYEHEEYMLRNYEYVAPTSNVVAYGTVLTGGAPWRLYDNRELIVDAGSINMGMHGFWSIWNAYRNYISHIIFTGPITSEGSLNGLFHNLYYVVTIDGLYHFDTSNVTHMAGMFSGTRSLTNIDISSWDTSSVIYMNAMFRDVGNIEFLDLSDWDTRNVTDKRDMFGTANGEGAKVRQIRLGEHFIISEDIGNLTIPICSTNTGRWQNIGNGTPDNPQGSIILSSFPGDFDSTLMAGEVFVWQQRPSTSAALPAAIRDIFWCRYLASAVRWQLDIPYDGALDAIVSAEQLAEITSLRFANSIFRYIEDFEGVQHLTSLDTLYISNSTIMGRFTNQDIVRIAEFVSTTNITKLFLDSGYDDNITDLTPLAEAINLTALSLPSLQTSNIQPLAGLSKLESLSIPYLPAYTDFSMLAGLTNLTSLGFFGIQVTDLDPLVTLLEGLPNLISLDVSSSTITELTPLARLNSLQELHLLFISATDISPLAELMNLRVLNLGRSWKGTTTDGPLTDISPLANLINLEQLRLEGHRITDITPLASLTNLMQLDVSYNRISDFRPLAGLTKLDEFSLSIGDQNIILPIRYSENPLIIENNIFDIDGTRIVPSSISDGGIYNSPYITWIGLLEDVNEVTYTFVNTGGWWDHSRVSQPLIPPDTSPLPPIPGNVTRSGNLSSADVGTLRAYLAGFPVDICREAADVNADGAITAADVALIRAYLAGHPVTLLPAPRVNDFNN